MYRVAGSCASGSFDATVTEQSIALDMALRFYERNVAEGPGEVGVSLAGQAPLRLLVVRWDLDDGVDR